MNGSLQLTTDNRQLTVPRKAFEQRRALFFHFFIPPKHEAKFVIRLLHIEERGSKPEATAEKGEAYRKELEAYVDQEFPDFNGFVRLDKKNRYRIQLPKDW